jgi:hypothetical protein
MVLVPNLDNAKEKINCNTPVGRAWHLPPPPPHHSQLLLLVVAAAVFWALPKID